MSDLGTHPSDPYENMSLSVSVTSEEQLFSRKSERSMSVWPPKSSSSSSIESISKQEHSYNVVIYGYNVMIYGYNVMIYGYEVLI